MPEDNATSTALSTTTTASDGSSLAAAQRPRHQFTRSLSELSSPVRLHRSHNRHHRHDSQEHSGNALSASTPYSPPPASGLARSSRASLETGRPDGSIPPGVSITASPSSSRRPSVRISLENHREEPHQQPHHHHHHHSSHRHRSTGGGSSSSGGHQNTPSVAALAAAAAAATAAAAGSPTPLQISTLAIPHRTSDSGGSIGGSGTVEETARAPLPGTIVPPPDTDPVLVAAMRRLQHDQDRAAARLLQATLADLDGLSASTGQRLDAVYGSVLSRLSILQGTVQALRSLAISARTTNIHFRAEARSLADEVEQQLAHFEGSGGGGEVDSTDSAAAAAAATTTPALSGPLPSDQQRRLEQLHVRVLAGRTAVEALGGRVKVIRERVERWERADLAWQERTRTRLKVLWAIVSGVVLALVVLLVVMARSNKAGRGTLAVPDDVGQLVGNHYSSLASTEHKHERHISFHNSSDGDGAAAVSKADTLVRLFDEL